MRGYLNEETKEIIAINQITAKKLGLPDYEIEFCEWNKKIYLKGYAPEKPQEAKEKDVRGVRDIFLKKYVDFYQEKPLLWEELDDEKKKNIKQYRTYLKDYPESSEDWFEKDPLTFEDWLNSNTQEEQNIE